MQSRELGKLELQAESFRKHSRQTSLKALILLLIDSHVFWYYLSTPDFRRDHREHVCGHGPPGGVRDH